VIETTLSTEALVAFLFAMVRTVAWLTTAPPFAGALLNARVRVGLAVGLAWLMADRIPMADVDYSIGALVLAIAYQVFMGVALGFVIRLYFVAFEVAGSFIDFASGLSIGAVYDPLSGSQNAPIARFYGLMATVLLFASGGHLLILNGYMLSFDAAPLSGPTLDHLGRVFMEGLGVFFIAALQIAFPIAAVLLITEIGLALLARAAPQANVLMLGLTAKALVLILLLGTALAVLPWAVDNLADQATRAAVGLW
jgi:flagellar biosynthetic protein FliR